MNVSQLLQKKRDGGTMEEAEIRYVVEGFTKGTMPEYQMAAFLAFVFCRGMSSDETQVLTRVMMESGRVLSWPRDRFYVDKHSTGGIGDKVSLILAPLVAACGVKVPMISGRGLGHTGGTLDKLEAIPGFSTDIDPARFQAIVDRVGCAIVGQTADICPADKKIYALRDVTGTVPSLPLIVSSILSKKLAEGVDGLVLDVKCGSGAFMKTLPEARALARAMVDVGKLAGRRTVALLTDMSQPLGRAVGNALEVTESIEILQNKLADSANDLREVTLALGVEMLLMAGAATDSAGALRLLEEKLADGSAYKMFSEMVAAQGGDLGKPMAKSRFVTPAGAAVSGIVLSIDSERIGWAAIALGAGRKVASDGVDHAVGFTQLRKIGEKVELGAPLCLVHHTAENVDSVISELRAAFVLSAEPPPPRGPIVIERLE